MNNSDDNEKDYSKIDIEDDIDSFLSSKNPNILPQNNKKILKKKKIGFKLHKKKKTKIKKEKTQKQRDETPKNIEEHEDTKTVTHIDRGNENNTYTDDKQENSLFSAKRKTFIKKDMKGKTVYLEDTGEKLGTVFNSIYDKDNNIVGYKIKDLKTESILSFPLDQFDENKDGLIFIPGWYTKALKTIEKLEFKDRVSPELTALLSDDEDSNNELYEVFAKHDDEMSDYIQKAMGLKEILRNHLKVLSKKRISLKEDLMDLTERRLIKDIDRKEFSEDVMRHRRKVNILDVNINKCKILLKRLDTTSFGALGKNIMTSDLETEKSFDEKTYFKKQNEIIYDKDIQMPYKEKYYELKNQFEHLEEQYVELRTSVQKLFNKNDL